MNESFDELESISANSEDTPESIADAEAQLDEAEKAIEADPVLSKYKHGLDWQLHLVGLLREKGEPFYPSDQSVAEERFQKWLRYIKAYRQLKVLKNQRER